MLPPPPRDCLSRRPLRQTGTTRKRIATEAPEDPAPRTSRRATKASGIMGSTAAAVHATPMQLHKDLPFTPAAHKGHPSVMGTCMRLPRRGESIMSSRGSPMGVRETDAAAYVMLDENNKIDYLAVGMGDQEYNVADANVRESHGFDTMLSPHISIARDIVFVRKFLVAHLRPARCL